MLSWGNVDVKGEIPIEDFTYVLPEVMRDPAFIDRIHGFIPRLGDTEDR